MNKTFKVIWNHATQSWVAVSELNKSKGKTKSFSQKGLFRLSLVSFGLALASGQVIAVTGAENQPSGSSVNYCYYKHEHPSGQLVCGSSSTSATGKGAIAIGNGVVANSTHTNGVIAIGLDTKIDGAMSIALGASNNVTGSFANVVGQQNYVANSYSDVFGSQNKVATPNPGEMVDIGAFGRSNKIFNSRQAYALGRNNTIGSTNHRVDGGLALGNNNFVFGKGSASISTNDGNNQPNNVNRLHASIIGASGSYSIGTGNVIGSSSTGSMLLGSRIRVGASDATVTTSDKNDGNHTVTYNDLTDARYAVALGNNVTVNNGTDSIAMGRDVSVNGTAAVAMGYQSTANGTAAVAIGRASNATNAQTIAIGDRAKALQNNAIAMGQLANANGTQAISIGDRSNASGNASVALGPSTTSTGVSSTALGDGAKSTERYATSVGAFSKSSGPSSIALGHDANATHANSVALGSNSLSAAANKVSSANLNGLTYGTFAGNNPSSTVSIGSSGNERQIVNVAAGRISNTSTDAINGSQLYATNNILGNLATSTKNLLGGNATLAPNGTLNMTNIGGTGKGNIHDAIAASITEVKAGTNIASVDKTLGANDQPIYTVNADGTSVSSGDDYVTVTPGTKDANNVTDYAVSLSDKAKEALEKAESAVQNIVTQVNGKTVKTIGKDDNTMNFVNGNATTARADSTNITFDVETDNSTIKIENGKVAANTTELSYNKAGEVEKPTNPTALVNASTVANAINNAGFTLKTSATPEGHKDTSSTPDELITPGTTIEMVAGKNLEIKQEANGKITYATKENVTFTTVNATTVNATTVNATTVNVGDTKINSDGLTIENGPSITKEGINAADKKITNVANGTISADSKDAVNGSQLYAVTENVTKNANEINKLASNTIKLGGDSGTTEAQALNKEGGLQFNVKGENGLTTSASGTDIKVSITQSTITADENGNVTAGNTGNAYATAGDVAKAINDAQKTTVVEAGKNVTVGSNTVGKVTTYTVNAEKTTVTSNTDKLIVTAGDKDNNGVTNYAIDLSQETKDLIDNAANKDLSNITDAGKNVIKGLVAMEDGENTKVTTKDKNGVKTFKVDVTTTDIEMDGNAVKSTDLTAPVSAKSVADAINNSGFTLKTSAIDGGEKDDSSTDDEVITPNKTVEMVAGKNLTVKQSANGTITYATKDDVNFNSVNVGNATINTDGLTIKNGPSITKDGVNAGDKKITNVANGTSANDAVNLSQLNATKTTVVGVGAVNVTSTSDANGTVYTVRADVDNTTIKIDAEGKIAANTGAITAAPNNITDVSGNVLPNAGVVTVVADEGNRVATVQNVADAINSAGWVINTGKADDQNSFDTKAQNHAAKKVAAGNQVNFKAGKNMEVKRDGNDIIYATSNDVSFNTVTVGNTKISNDGVRITGGPSMTTNGIDAGSKRITNVAPGIADTDAVNVSQLKGATANINNQLNKMDKRRKAGHASGLAAAGLMQAYREGQSAVTAGVAQYQNESAVAVGYSRIADSGKYGVKASFSANTQGEVGGAVSAGYFW